MLSTPDSIRSDGCDESTDQALELVDDGRPEAGDHEASQDDQKHPSSDVEGADEAA
jgi:hypothetical protein